jgi:hypothetical protein
LPELALVWLELPDVALPVEPPVVWPVAELFPLPPEVAVAVEPSLAFPVRPEEADPWTLPDVGWLAGCDGVAPALPAVRSNAPATSPLAHSVLINSLSITGVNPFEVVVPTGTGSVPIWPNPLKWCPPRTGETVQDRAEEMTTHLVGAAEAERGSAVGRVSEVCSYDRAVVALTRTGKGLARRNGDGHRTSANLIVGESESAHEVEQSPGVQALADKAARIGSAIMAG